MFECPRGDARPFVREGDSKCYCFVAQSHTCEAHDVVALCGAFRKIIDLEFLYGDVFGDKTLLSE